MGNRDIVHNEINGFLIEKPDTNAFFHKINLLYQDAEVYAKISHTAVDFAQSYDISKTAIKLLKLYTLHK